MSALVERLKAILDPIERDTVQHRWLRRKLADSAISTADMIVALREIGWRQSFRCRPSGEPRHSHCYDYCSPRFTREFMRKIIHLFLIFEVLSKVVDWRIKKGWRILIGD
jgi:hypothetical protein